MKTEFIIETIHPSDGIIQIVSDGKFFLSQFLKAEVEQIDKGLWRVSGSVMFRSFIGKAREYVGQGTVSYVITFEEPRATMSVKIAIVDKKVHITVEYEGWNERLAGTLLKNRASPFIQSFDEIIKKERIIRRI